MLPLLLPLQLRLCFWAVSPQSRGEMGRGRAVGGLPLLLAPWRGWPAPSRVPFPPGASLLGTARCPSAEPGWGPSALSGPLACGLGGRRGGVGSLFRLMGGVGVPHHRWLYSQTGIEMLLRELSLKILGSERFGLSISVIPYFSRVLFGHRLRTMMKKKYRLGI